MKKYLSILFVLSLTINTFVLAQESESEETEVSSVEAVSYTHLTLPTILLV